MGFSPRPDMLYSMGNTNERVLYSQQKQYHQNHNNSLYHQNHNNSLYSSPHVHHHHHHNSLFDDEPFHPDLYDDSDASDEMR